VCFNNNNEQAGVGLETRIQVRSFDSDLNPEQFQVIPRFPVYAVLENLRSAFNVGSIIRTADCALLKMVYLCGITAHPPHRKLDKTSLGALPFVQWEYRESALEAVRECRSKSIPVAALELTDRSQCLWEIDFPLPVALVMGNEALGVSREVLNEVDHIVEIPMLGYKNSINVAVAFGVAVYEIQRQHWGSASRDSWKTRLKRNQPVRQTGPCRCVEK